LSRTLIGHCPARRCYVLVTARATEKFGHFQRNKVWRRLVDDPTRSVRVIDFKEKGSDVNLAAYLVHDALSGRWQLAGVMSSYSDLVEPIALAREALPKGVIVFSPNVGSPTRSLANAATDARRIRDRVFTACHFPDELRDEHGVIQKPVEW
jgi:hypothetical protein